MSNNMSKYLLFNSTVLGMSLIVFSPLMAKAEASSRDDTSEIVDNEQQLLEQIEKYSPKQTGNSVNQVTNVNQLRDVSPTDWAYEALRSLVDRYGCIAGFPNQTYRGNESLSRYEFAAGLNSCLNQIERLIASDEAIVQEDIATLQRLMQEFEAELATMGGRVDNLDSRTAVLEDNQFSTTTKLNGEVIFGLTNSFGKDNDNQAILGDRIRLELNSSFTGKDRLVTRLAAGNFGRFKNDFEFDSEIDGVSTTTSLDNLESSTTNQTFNIFPGEDNDISIDWLAYYAPIKLGDFAELDTYVAAFGGIHSDYVPTLNPFFEDLDGGNGALSTFASENPIYRIGGGAGVATKLDVKFLESIFKSADLTVGYLAGGAGDPSKGSGLFNGDFGLLAQFDFDINDSIDLGFTYVRGFHKADSPIFGAGADSGSGIVGTALANLSESELADAFVEGAGVDQGVAEDFFEIGDKTTNNFGTELAWRISDKASFSAFFTYTDVSLTEGGDSADIWTYGAGVAFPDLLKERSVLGIFAGVQPYLGGVDIGGLKVENSNPIHVESFFKFPLSDYISVTPGIIYLANPEQTDDSRDQVIGTLRTTFTF